MKARTIHPGFFANEELGKLPFRTRLVFIGLWCLADREGRLEYRPERLKALILPYEADGIENDVQSLLINPGANLSGWLLRYEVNGKSYLQILNWYKFQKPHHTEIESIIPEPPNKYNNLINNELYYSYNRLKNKYIDYTSINKNISLSVVGGGLGGLRGEGGSVPLGHRDDTVMSPLSIPEEIKGLKLYETNQRLICMLPEMIVIWKRVFKELNIAEEIKLAHAWEVIHASRRKKDKIKFLHNWMRKACDIQKGNANGFQFRKNHPIPKSGKYSSNEKD